MFPPCLSLNNQSTLSRALLRLSLELYMAEALSPDSRQFFETLTPLDNLAFIANREKFLLPENFAPAPLEIIWRTIDNDAAGIFCRGVTPSESGAKNDFVLCAASLGETRNGTGLAAGFIGSEKWHRHSDMQELFYSQIGLLRRFFDEFSHLKVLCSLLDGGSRFDYIIDQATSQVLAFRSPGRPLTAVSTLSQPDSLSDSLLTAILRKNPLPDDNSATPLPDNMQITRFQIAGFDYAAISLNNPLSSALSPDDAYYSRRELTHLMNNKLGALQSAVEQLQLRQGRPVSDADLKLIEIIEKVTGEMAEALSQFDSDNQSVPAGTADSYNLPRISTNYINRRIVLVNE